MENQSNEIVALLMADHQKVEGLFSKLDATPLSELEGYFCGLREELVRHEVAEEVVVYPTFRQHVPGADEIADKCIAEQSKAEQTLAALEKEDASSESFRIQLKELRQAVLSHAKHEESDVFPALSSHLESDELQNLGERYEHALKAAPTHPHPHAPDTPPGNQVLGPLAALVDKTRDAMRSVA